MPDLNNDKALGRLNPFGDALFIQDRRQHQLRFTQMLHSATARLPELDELEKYCRDHASELDSLDLEQHDIPSDLDDHLRFSRSAKGMLVYSGFSTALIDACSCDGCKVVDKNPTSHSSLDDLCLSKIAFAVFEFIWSLAWLDVDDTIRPSSNGLMGLYSKIKIENPYQVRSKCLDDQAFGHAVLLLTGFQTGIPQHASAVAVHGLCAYRSSLEHPNIGVEGQSRLRIVPGQIERNEKFYNHITDIPNPWFSQRRTKTKANGDETSSVIAILGARPRLQIAIEETLNASSLSTRLVVTPETISQIHWNFLHRPFLNREVQIHYQESCFLSGPGQLSMCMRAAFDYVLCQKIHRSSVTHPVWAPQSSAEPWSGRCSIMDLPWWTDDPGEDGRFSSTPLPNEWIVAVLDDLDSLRVFRGSPPLLYCILDRFCTNDERAYLLQSSECLVCMVLESVFGAERKIKRLSVISPETGGELQTLEFRLRLDRMSVEMDSQT